MLSKQLSTAFVVLSISLAAFAQIPQADTPEQISKIAGWKGAKPKSEGAFTFVVVSDRSGGNVRGMWDVAVKEVNLLQPDFIMSVGDLINKYTEDREELLREWDEFDSMARKFNAPFFYCAGNHDVSRPGMLDVYRELHGVKGKTYYSFNYRDCHFLVLDSVTAVNSRAFADEQFEWAQKDLAAAKDASHVFVFYHYPLWGYPELWKRLRPMLPEGKTTIFNGHLHRLLYREIDGIPTYVLASTANNRDNQRPIGSFRMFAQVTVDRGEATVAFLPLHEVLSIDYAKHMADIRTLSGRSEPPAALPIEGGRYTFRQTNALSVPVRAELKWDATGWDVSPQTAELSFEPGGKVKREFTLKTTNPEPSLPKLSVIYRFKDPRSGKEVELNRTVKPGLVRQMRIARAGPIVVDGDPSEFAKTQPLTVAGSSYAFYRGNPWTGPDDCSYTLRLATDGENLLAAVDVNDDRIHIDPRVGARRNDAIELFWDARDADKRTGRHGEGTGHVSIIVPDENAAPRVQWDMDGRKAPEGLKVACKRREGGYVFELSIPLDQLGVQTPVAAGREMLFQICVDDRDPVDNRVNSTRMSASGLGNNERHTVGYIRCVFE